MGRKRLAGSGNNGLTKLESSTVTWYDLGSSKEEETAIFHQLTEPLDPTPMLWMWIRSISLRVKEQSTLETTNASSVTRRDAVTFGSGRDERRLKSSSGGSDEHAG